MILLLVLVSLIFGILCLIYYICLIHLYIYYCWLMDYIYQPTIIEVYFVIDLCVYRRSVRIIVFIALRKIITLIITHSLNITDVLFVHMHIVVSNINCSQLVCLWTVASSDNISLNKFSSFFFCNMVRHGKWAY